MKKYLLMSLSLIIIMTVNALAQDTLILQPGPEGKDAFLDDLYTFSLGDYPNLFALAGTSSGVPLTCRGIMEFDLTSIPPGSVILEAKISLYYANNAANPHTHYGQNDAFLQRVIEPWEEDTITWYNQPQTTTVNQVRLPASTDPEQDYEDIDVTILIQDIVSDPENSHGILLKLQVEEMYRRLMFASGDYAIPEKRPKLEVIYDTCAAPTAEFAYETDNVDVSFSSLSDYATSWYWDFGDGYFSDLENPWHQYSGSGNYQVCLYTWNICGADTVCQWIEICEKPVSAFGFMIDDMTAFFEDHSEIADEYYWDFGDGYYSNLVNPVHIYDYPGEFEVCLVTWNECGSDTTCETLYLGSVLVTEPGEGKFIIYPNPARDVAYIKTIVTGPGVIILNDLSGKEVFRNEITGSENGLIKISLDQVKPGIYITRLIILNDNYYSKLSVIR